MAVMPAAEHTYDANNRLKMEQTVGGGKTPFTTYLYDANGNLTASINPAHRTDYAYNGFNQLMFTWSGRSGTAYTYNAQGIRTSKVTANTTTSFLLDGGDVVGEMQNGVLISAYLRGINLIRRVIMGGVKYYLFNGHGDVVHLTDESGGVTRYYDYDAFGNEKFPDSTDTNPFRYCGEYFDTETGTYYLRARYYDPSRGRFLTEDPAKDGLNWYAYCRNNPIKYIDPTGYWAASDSKYSSTVQAVLLQLTVAWYMAPTDEQKKDISNRANEIREIASSGFGAFLDRCKSITGAAADDFSWFLGGDVSKAERDYWLSEAQKFQSDIVIDDKTDLRAMIFIAGIASPSPDDAWRMISKKASKEMLETVGEKGAKKFIKSISKYAGAQGTNGIKKLQGSGIKGYMYEVKVKGVGGAYRLLGNKTESGEILWELFEKTH